MSDNVLFQLRKTNWSDLTCYDNIHIWGDYPFNNRYRMNMLGATCCGGQRAKVRCLDNVDNMCQDNSHFVSDAVISTSEISTEEEWMYPEFRVSSASACESRGPLGHNETSCLSVQSDSGQACCQWDSIDQICRSISAGTCYTRKNLTCSMLNNKVETDLIQKTVTPCGGYWVDADGGWHPWDLVEIEHGQVWTLWSYVGLGSQAGCAANLLDSSFPTGSALLALSTFGATCCGGRAKVRCLNLITSICKKDDDFISNAVLSRPHWWPEEVTLTCHMLNKDILENLNSHLLPLSEYQHSGWCFTPKWPFSVPAHVLDVNFTVFSDNKCDWFNLLEERNVIDLSPCRGGERAKVRCFDNSNICKNDDDFLPHAMTSTSTCATLNENIWKSLNREVGLLPERKGQGLKMFSDMKCEEMPLQTMLQVMAPSGPGIATCCGGEWAKVRWLDDQTCSTTWENSNMCKTNEDFMPDALVSVEDQKTFSCAFLHFTLLSIIMNSESSFSFTPSEVEEEYGPYRSASESGSGSGDGSGVSYGGLGVTDGGGMRRQLAGDFAVGGEGDFPSSDTGIDTRTFNFTGFRDIKCEEMSSSLMTIMTAPGIAACCGVEQAKVRCLDSSNMCKNNVDFRGASSSTVDAQEIPCSIINSYILTTIGMATGKWKWSEISSRDMACLWTDSLRMSLQHVYDPFVFGIVAGYLKSLGENSMKSPVTLADFLATHGPTCCGSFDMTRHAGMCPNVTAASSTSPSTPAQTTSSSTTSSEPTSSSRTTNIATTLALTTSSSVPIASTSSASSSSTTSSMTTSIGILKSESTSSSSTTSTVTTPAPTTSSSVPIASTSSASSSSSTSSTTTSSGILTSESTMSIITTSTVATPAPTMSSSVPSSSTCNGTHGNNSSPFDLGGNILCVPEEFFPGENVLKCAFDGTWAEVRDGVGKGVMQTGGLGKMMIDGEWEVWMCGSQLPCALAKNDWVCFTYNEIHGQFVPWGYNRRLRLF